MLGIRPGGRFSFERPPFKLTSEMVDILDGPNSELFREYKELIVQVRDDCVVLHCVEFCGGCWREEGARHLL